MRFTYDFRGLGGQDIREIGLVGGEARPIDVARSLRDFESADRNDLYLSQP
jgi:hypothetical protein